MRFPWPSTTGAETSAKSDWPLNEGNWLRKKEGGGERFSGAAEIRRGLNAGSFKVRSGQSWIRAVRDGFGVFGGHEHYFVVTN